MKITYRGKPVRRGARFRVKGLNKTQVKSVKAIARKEARKLPEVKTFGYETENIELYHNKAFYSPNWLACKQGVQDPDDLSTQATRIGDEIYLRNVNIRLWLSNKGDRPNVMYKAVLFWYDSTITLSDAYVYFTQTNKMLDRINNENISIIDQKTVFSKENYAQVEKEHSYLCTLNGNWKGKKITYDEGGTTPKKRDIGMVVVAYDAYGTLQTDNIASFAYNGVVRLQDP